MNVLTNNQMANCIAGRQPDWGDFLSGACSVVGFGLTILPMPGSKAVQTVLKVAAAAEGIACSGADFLKNW